MQKIIIHGGCGAREDKNTSFSDYHEHLLSIIKKSYEYLVQVDDARKVAIFAAKLLEDDDIFNAGTGSRVQQDGQIRMSASIMDSIRKKFAGVINIQNVKNPVDVANKLAEQHNSVLAGQQATDFAHNIMDLEAYNPMTEKRWKEYLSLKKGYTGTIGVVVLDSKNNICAITSTGGAGFEYPGRVGDSPTVAGNFVNDIVGISCTGIGEHIVNEGVAVKIATRVKDGMSLEEAVDKSINESDELGYYVGLIALDKKGNIYSGSTKVAQTLYAYADGNKIRTFYEEKM
ncbi:isoaspartyl peptidase/L-asparaginase [Francisella frigiditurris]|uniref:Isoaspartyl peptidase/L-asparaginase n=1 Tax=Francisella frigiditurris TaxID=1542390 RepID=A0A1J0KTY1_9GAMM|nr:isoaspartyl peptidase/L-asparaginase [Francisella frigiditurris]APC97147.1 isoaspartyl peptidase/L-asparaginase [Francisella frigiditurris]